MISRIGRRVAVLVGVVLVLFLLFVPSAAAQEKTLRWHRWDSDIQINADGTFTVRETYEIEFIGGTFTFGYRNIPIDQFISLQDVKIGEGQLAYDQSYGESANTFYVNQSSTEYVIKWFFPPTADSTRVFTIQYTVVGGLIIDEQVGDRFFWKAVGPDHAFPIESSTVTVHMPPGAAVDMTIKPAFFGVDATYAIASDLSSVTYQASNIPANQDFEVGVRFPHGFVPNVKPPWQDAYERDQIWRDKFTLVFLVLGILVLIVGVLGVYLLWLFAGRDPRVGVVPDYLAEPPSELPPGLAGTLIDEKADLQDIVATLVDLARRGAVEIEEKEKTIFGIATSKDFVYHKKPDFTGSLRPYEKLLLDEVFSSGAEVKLDDLREKFYVAIPKLRNALYQESVQEGLFPASPKAIRGRYLALGIAGIVLSVGICFCTTAALPPLDTLWCPFAALGVGAISLAAVSSAMPAKSRKGAEEAAKWRAFKVYLQNAERYADLKAVADQFDQYLPYAIAFGLDKGWIKKFSRVEGTPVPGWYFPVGIPYGQHMGLPSGGGLPGSGGDVRGLRGKAVRSGSSLEGMSGGAGRDLRGEAVRPGLSLGGISGGMSRGLSSMSEGLSSMLSTTASAFTSVPRASSSGGWSGGGFSGGGFSGGGFSGGGGGGGGGAGFG